MNKIYTFGLFLGFFIVFCSAEEASLQETLKGFEGQKLKIDQEVTDAKNDISNLQKQNSDIRKDFLDNKRSLQLDTFKFIDEENAKKLADLKAEMKRLDELKAKVAEDMKDLMNSDAEYKRANNEANGQFEEIKKIREELPKANRHYTEELKNQREIDAKILKIKKQIELEKKESTGDKK